MNAPTSQVLTEAGGDLSQIHPRALDVFADGHLSGKRLGYTLGWRAGYAARAQQEINEWIPVRDHLYAYVRSFHGLKNRREDQTAHRSSVSPHSRARMIANAYQSWEMQPPNGGSHHD